MRYLIVLLLLCSLADASTNRVNEITTNGSNENLIVNASGPQIIFERDLNLTEDFFWSGLQWFYDNDTDQEGRIISLEDRPLEPNIDAANVTSGTLLNARMNDTWLVTTSDCSAGQVLVWPSTCVSQWASQPSIDWANITTGTAPQLNIDAANITSGTILNARYNMTYLALASDVTNLWTNASNQDGRIITLEGTATANVANITNLWTNASIQEGKFASYLPLAGGIMTGNINMSNTKNITNMGTICMDATCSKYIMANTTGLYFIT